MRLRVVVASIVLLISLTSCAPAQGPASPGLRSEATREGVASKSPGAWASGASASVTETLRFTATTVDGAAFDGTTLAGKPAVLWFWAPWCGTCAGQAVSVAEMDTKYEGKVTVVGVAGLGERPAMREFIRDLEVGGVVHLDDRAGVVWRRFGVTEQSVYVLLDAAGTVVHRGWLDSVRFEEKVAALAA